MPVATASSKARGHGTAPSSRAMSSETGRAAAVSASKKRANRGTRRGDDASSSDASVVSPFGELCIALYRPNNHRKKTPKDSTSNNNNSNSNNNNSRSKATRDIWWPALRFASIIDFQQAMEANLLQDGSQNRSGRKSLEWSSRRKMKRHRKMLANKVVTEALSDRPIETLCYLGRPLDEYVTADDAIEMGVEVQGFNLGLKLLIQQAKRPWFPRLFLSASQSKGDQPEDSSAAEALELFRDFYVAFEESILRVNKDDSDSDDSDSDDSDSDDSEDEDGAAGGRQAQSFITWANTGQKIWDNYHNRRQHHDDSHESSLEAEASPKPLMAPHGQQHPDSEEDREHEEEDDEEDPPLRDHPPAHAHDDASVAAQSAAAVSYTEASLMSASRGGGGTVAPVAVAPPALKDGILSERDSFETIWHKHEMEGWDRYLHEEFSDKSETMVYEAPNGYKFDTERAFLRYLTETYGFCGGEDIESPQQRSASRSSPRRGRSAKPRKPSDTRARSTSRSRSRSRSQDFAGRLEWSELWLYLTNTLEWTYNYATRQDMKVYGMNTTALWFRPGFDIKHRGELGRDHFISEDAVLKYCLEHDIRPPHLEHEDTRSSRADDEEEEAAETSKAEEPEDDDDNDSESNEDYDSSTEEVASDDPGYSTPDDQSTVPQDPGKPRLPSPPPTDSSGASGSSGGSYYSYDDDPDRYVFPNLWQRLKNKGWSWCKAKNSLEDYWYIRPASMRPESQWIRGVDYFGTEEAVIEFVKERDEISLKEREERRKERMLQKQQRAHEEASAGLKTLDEESQPSEEATSKRPAKKQNEKKKQTRKKPDPKKKRRNSSDVGEGDAKSSKQRKTNAGRKKKRGEAPREGFSVRDANLEVDSHSLKAAPWAKNMPRYEHKLCLKATGVQWANSFYYLPGEDNKRFTARFQNVGDVARHYALNPSSVVWASGEKVPSNEAEQSFERLIRYALVPGLQSVWGKIRKITRSETSFLLRKLGYRIQGTTWEPPDALVATGHLERQYSSLESLCDALRFLSGDLQTPPTRRRKQELKITETQLLALRLCIAEGVAGPGEDKAENTSESESDSTATEGDSAKKGKRGRPRKEQPRVDSNSTPASSKVATKKAKAAEDDSIATEESSGQKRKRGRPRKEKPYEERVVASPEPTTEDSQSQEEPLFYLSPTEQKMKDFAEDEEQQIAMSPSKIKVGKFRKNPKDNTAPWAVNPPAAPKIGWSRMYYKMGITYNCGYYYLPGQSTKNYSKRFSKVEDIRAHICEEGNYSLYLDKLNTEERKLVRRHLDYCYVTGNPYEWCKLRELDIQETILFLNLLGFEKSPGEYGWWQIPAGVPILENQSYPTLAELCKALVRLPDLEDRTLGMTNRRRSRRKDEDLVLSDYQMMALRLRIAEGFEDDERVVDEHQREVMEKNKLLIDSTNNNKLLIHFTKDEIDRLWNEAKDHSMAWEALQNLGCTWSSCRYRVPGIRNPIDAHNEMVELILQQSVNVLDWDHCTLTDKEIRIFERYLRAFYLHIADFQLVEKALGTLTKANINDYLGKFDIRESEGSYYIDSDKFSESEMVNMIRCTDDLNFLGHKPYTPVKRRRWEGRILSKLEALSLRLWAVFIDIPLTNMPKSSTIGRAVNTGNNEGEKTESCNTMEAESRCEVNSQEINRESVASRTNSPKHDKTEHSMTVSEKKDLTIETAAPDAAIDAAEEAKATESFDKAISPSENGIPSTRDLDTNDSVVNSDTDRLGDSQRDEAVATNIDADRNSSSTDPPTETGLEESTTATGEKIVNSNKPSLPSEHSPPKKNHAAESHLASVEASASIDIDESSNTVGTSVNVPNDMEQAMDANPATVEDHAQNPLGKTLATEITTEIAEVAAESSCPAKIAHTDPAADPVQPPIPMETEEGAGTCVDQRQNTEPASTKPNQVHATSDQLKPSPVTESAAQIADLLMQSSRDRSFVAGDLATPPPKKQRRSKKDRCRADDSSSRRSSPRLAAAAATAAPASLPPAIGGLSDFHTPKQFDGDQQLSNGAAAAPTAEAQAIQRSGASRTASCHEEAFREACDLLTQPSFEHDVDVEDLHDESLRNMESSAELDFQPSYYSPQAVVATKKIKRSHQYGRQQAPSVDYHDGSHHAGLLTQQDANDDDWFEKSLLD